MSAHTVNFRKKTFVESVLSLLMTNFIIHGKQYLPFKYVLAQLDINRTNFYKHVKTKEKLFNEYGISIMVNPLAKDEKIFVLQIDKIIELLENFNKGMNWHDSTRCAKK